MSEEKKKAEAKNELQRIDTGVFLSKLACLIEESGAMAEYTGETVGYGRALGFAEGRCSAYSELFRRAIDREFE